MSLNSSLNGTEVTSIKEVRVANSTFERVREAKPTIDISEFTRSDTKASAVQHERSIKRRHEDSKERLEYVSFMIRFVEETREPTLGP